MVKKYLVSLLAVFVFSFSVVGAYAQAETANPTAPQKILEGMFGGLATAVGATTAIGLKSKEIYDENKQAIYDNAVKAYQGMSNAAKESWAAAVARGKTGVDMAGELWDGLQGVFDKIYASKATVSGPYSVDWDGNYLRFMFDKGYMYRAEFVRSDGTKSTYEDRSLYITHGETYMEVLGVRYQYTYLVNYRTWNDVHNMLSGIKSIAALNAIAHVPGTDHWEFSVIKDTGAVVNEVNPIYDQALKRALETDIPRAKDAGLVIPAPDITVPATGQRVKYDANTGTLTLPDGSIYTGDGKDLSLGIPTVGVSPGGSAVWQDGKTDTDVWTGTKTDPITGDVVKPGEGAGTIDGSITGKLDGILDGIKDIPASIGALLTKLFVPVGSIAAFADLTDTFRSRLVLPSFGWLVTDGIVCSQDGKDIKVEFNGKETTFVDMSWLYNVRSFYMPIMRGFLWFLFGWYAYRKIIAITNKVDGIKE